MVSDMAALHPKPALVSTPDMPDADAQPDTAGRLEQLTVQLSPDPEAIGRAERRESWRQGGCG